MERDQIIKAIDDYCAASGLKPTTVCVYALKSQHLYDRLRAGGECLPRTAKKLLAWIEANPPSLPRSSGSE